MKTQQDAHSSCTATTVCLKKMVSVAFIYLLAELCWPCEQVLRKFGSKDFESDEIGATDFETLNSSVFGRREMLPNEWNYTCANVGNESG